VALSRPSLGVGVREFQREGHVQVRAFYGAGEIAGLTEALLRARPQSSRFLGDVDNALIRDMFLSRVSSEVSAFVRDPRLGALAAELLGCRRVRFMQDVMLEKGGRYEPTAWHRDSDFWSFSGAGALTVWIPLQDTPLHMSPLRYATGSHLVADPHPLRTLEMACIPLRFRIASSAMAVGDIAIHHYKTLHGAARNADAGAPRRSLGIHFIDADAQVRAPRNPGQSEHAVRCDWDRIADGDSFTDDIAPLV
jgi:ectoine hydroxylase-related dioxygenase (phytanoyl-CoA dioxygenase family)